MFAKLLGTVFGDSLHIFLGAEVQAARWTGFNASRFESYGDTVRAERALEHLLCGWIELRNIKRTSAHAIAATDTVLLLKSTMPLAY
jgi:hypothetical protein